MEVTYKDYLEQKENGSWKDSILIEVPMIQNPSVAGYIDELTYLRELSKKHHTLMNDVTAPLAQSNK